MNIITTGIDENPHYWDLLLAFLASIDANSPGTKVIVNTINLSPLQSGSLWAFGCVLETYSHIDGTASAFQKNYYRHEWIPSLLTANERVAWIDPDCIIRKPIDGIFDDVEPQSIKYWHKSGRKERHQFQGGVYVLGSSQKSIDFCDKVYSELEGTDDWMLPQTIMLRQLKKSKLKRVNLPESYNDSKFEDDSFIWHCKHSHFAEAKFQKEFRKYLQLGKEVIGE